MQIFYLLSEGLRALVLCRTAQAQDIYIFQYNSLIFNSEGIVHLLMFVINAILSLSIPN